MPSQLQEAVWVAGVRLMHLLNLQTQLRLKRLKGYQARNFELLRPRFSIAYDSLRHHDIARFTVPYWQESIRRLEAAILPAPEISFLRNPVIMHNMFTTRGGALLRFQMQFMKKQFSQQVLSTTLLEDCVGDPLLLRSKFLTSRNSVHHLFHIARFMNRTKCNLDDIETVVEWGGGYGNFAKLFVRLKQGALTYTIVDLPLISCLQWLYLSTVFGEEKVRLVLRPEDEIATGRINILPLCFLDRQKLVTDLFVSTWALSESSEYSQSLVASRKMFEARHVLLAYQETSPHFPVAERVGNIVGNLATIREAVPLYPSQHYVFA